MPTTGLFIDHSIVNDPNSDGYLPKIEVFHNQKFLFKEHGIKAFATKTDAILAAAKLAKQRRADYEFFKSVSKHIFTNQFTTK